MTTDKIILDATCSARSMWFQKEEEHTIYADERCVDLRCSDGKRWVVDPDVQMDFTDMPFEDNQFKLVVFDHRI